MISSINVAMSGKVTERHKVQCLKCHEMFDMDYVNRVDEQGMFLPESFSSYTRPFLKRRLNAVMIVFS
jgi:hypothetical protein